jgi:hypothetical protein
MARLNWKVEHLLRRAAFGPDSVAILGGDFRASVPAII